MTTPQAWEQVAEWWTDVRVCGCGCGRYCPTDLPGHAGLCSTLSTMAQRGMIDSSQHREMLARLPKSVEYVEGVRPFLWPTTKEGAQQRVDFCEDVAEGK